MPVSSLQPKTGEISHCWAEEDRQWRTSSGPRGLGLLATAAENGGLLCAKVPCMELLMIKLHPLRGPRRHMVILKKIESILFFAQAHLAIRLARAPFVLSHV